MLLHLLKAKEFMNLMLLVGNGIIEYIFYKVYRFKMF